MVHRLFLLTTCLSLLLTARALSKQWTVTDGLSTGEVHQIVELPNGQMLVNCEGVFCLSNGIGFQPIPCDYYRSYRLPHYGDGYGQLWQGDSLLWLRDFYRIYLFDARTRTFRYDINQRLTNSLEQRLTPSPPTVTDRQGGVWTATRQNGITYQSPRRASASIINGHHPLIDLARSTTDSQGSIWRCKSDGLEREKNGTTEHYHTRNVSGLPHDKTTFITELPDHRFLLCDSLCTLGYFYPERRMYEPLNPRLPALSQYRHLVGACVIDEQWTAVYSQNGAFLLDIKADTLAPLRYARTIERHSDKYNCMMLDSQKRLWIGTQNGLFLDGKKIDGLTNNCIRSLLADPEGNVWAGTSCGVSRITPHVINYGPEDGIPCSAMMERATCLTPDGMLVFASSPTEAVMFRPEWLQPRQDPLNVVITAISIEGAPLPLEQLAEDIIFPYDQNDISIQFSALHYAAPHHTRYRYRLTGLEKEWQPYPGFDGSLGAVEYRALPPGTYTFEVQAAIDDGKWNKATRTTIIILPPWWQTWWAQLAYCLITLLAFAGMLGYYVKRKREKLERENDSRVNQLFELREEARHQFAEATQIDPQKIGVNSEEQDLTERMLKAIEQHLSDSDYGVDQLAQDVFMSRSALYLKLRNMLGISPADFIRNVRLKRAAQLLTDTDKPINEISDLVGYNTHRAFATNFKKMFGVLPSEYRNPKGNPLPDES